MLFLTPTSGTAFTCFVGDHASSGVDASLWSSMTPSPTAVLGSLSFVWQFALFLPTMGAAVFVAICTLFKSRQSTQPRPKDASPSDVDSEHSP